MLESSSSSGLRKANWIKVSSPLAKRTVASGSVAVASSSGEICTMRASCIRLMSCRMTDWSVPVSIGSFIRHVPLPSRLSWIVRLWPQKRSESKSRFSGTSRRSRQSSALRGTQLAKSLSTRTASREPGRRTYVCRPNSAGAPTSRDCSFPALFHRTVARASALRPNVVSLPVSVQSASAIRWLTVNSESSLAKRCSRPGWAG